MTGAATIDRDDVLAAIRVLAVLAYFTVAGRRVGREFRTRTCPTCGPRSRADAVSINLETGRWHCHAHGCSGDVLALVAGLAGLDVASQFRDVLAVAAEIAGVQPSAPLSRSELAYRREHIARRAAEREAADVAEAARRRHEAVMAGTAYWGRLATTSHAGEAYLAGRAVSAVLELGLVRFTDNGDIAAPLYTADERIVNVVRRRIDGREPKILGLKGCPTAGTFVDSIADIVHDRDVVLTEGLFDALTARLAWPNAVVLGAHGAGNVPKIAAAAAPRIKLAKARLLLVPHDDVAGADAMTKAGRLAVGAGLKLHRDLLVINDLVEPDLNDAWVNGWRAKR